MKTEILKIKGDWQEVVDDCRFTKHKSPLGHEPSEAFKKAAVIAEHSPLRDITVKWEWPKIPHWVTVHWVRHDWEPLVETQREDETGIPRRELPQDAPQSMRGNANAQNLIDTMRKRLCYKSSPETRALAVDLKKALRPLLPELSDALVPHCVYRCGCPEPNGCMFFRHLYLKGMDPESLIDIQARYDHYNELFYRED